MLNYSKAKTILIVYPSAFKHGYMGGAKRLLQLMQAWNALGYRLILLAQYENLYRKLFGPIDDSLSIPVYRIALPLDGVKIEFINTLVYQLRNYAISFIYRRSRSLVSSTDWGSFAAKKLERGCFPITTTKLTDIDLVWSVSTGKLDSFVIAKKISDKYNIPWIMALHDPPGGTCGDTKDPLIMELFRFYLEKTDFIITTTESYRQELIDKYDVDTNKIQCLYMRCADTDKSVNIDKVPDDLNCRSEIRIGHFGRIHGRQGRRSLIPLLESLRTINSIKNIKAFLKLELAGTGKGIDEALQYASTYNLNDHIEYHGLKSVSEIDRLARNTDIILILQGKEQQKQVPNKVFDALSYRKPILGLVPNDSEVEQILIKSGLAFTAEPDDVESIVATLELIAKDPLVLCRWCDNANFEYIESFSEKSLPADLNQIMKQVL